MTPGKMNNSCKVVDDLLTISPQADGIQGCTLPTEYAPKFKTTMNTELLPPTRGDISPVTLPTLSPNKQAAPVTQRVGTRALCTKECSLVLHYPPTGTESALRFVPLRALPSQDNRTAGQRTPHSTAAAGLHLTHAKQSHNHTKGPLTLITHTT